MQEEQGDDERTVSRRRLLRKASTVAAGVAGAGVVGAVAVGSPAQAAAGGNLVLGADNSAGSNATGLSTTSANLPTLSLSNAALVADDFGGLAAGAPLTLVPSGNYPSGPAGSIGVAEDGTFYVVATEGYADYVYTSFNANTLVPITPQRVFDTRSAATRGRIVNASTALDSTGKAKAGATLEIDLTDYVYFGTAVFGNVLVISPVGAGYLTVFPFGATKTTSTIDFANGQTLANGFITGIGVADENTVTDAISIYSLGATHILLDITAFWVGGFGQVNPAYLGASAMAPDDKKARAQRARSAPKPNWVSAKK